MYCLRAVECARRGVRAHDEVREHASRDVPDLLSYRNPGVRKGELRVIDVQRQLLEAVWDGTAEAQDESGGGGPDDRDLIIRILIREGIVRENSGISAFP